MVETGPFGFFLQQEGLRISDQDLAEKGDFSPLMVRKPTNGAFLAEGINFLRLNRLFTELQRRRVGRHTKRGRIIPRRHRHLGGELEWEKRQAPRWSLRLRMAGRMEEFLWDEEADSTESPTIPFELS